MIETKNYADQEIIERILQGDKALFEILVRRFNATLYKIGRSYNYGLEDTKDLMQETFISAYKNLSKFEHRSTFKTWIVRIMLNNCYRRKNKPVIVNEGEIDLDDNRHYMLKGSSNDTEVFIRRHELAHIIETALLKIPLDYRMVFSLREITGLSVVETSDLLHISSVNVKVRLNRAKAMLRKEITKVYAADELFEFNLIHCDEIVNVVMDYVNAD